MARGIGAPVYAMLGGTITRITQGARGGSGLSQVAIYNASQNKTLVYLHSDPLNSLRVGQSIAKGARVGTEDWRGISSSGAAHTHVEMRTGRQTSAAKSVGDPSLPNPNPTSFWMANGYNICCDCRDVAVDGPLDALAERLGVDEHDEVELEALAQLGGQGADAIGCRVAGLAHDTGDPVGVGVEPGLDDGREVDRRAVTHRDAGPPDRGGDVGIGQGGTDDRFGLDHDLLGGAVVDRQRGQLDPVEADPVEAFVP